MPESLHCRVTGRVQGVYFRAWTREAARELDLFGWVKNMPDGSVEVLAQGDEPSLEKLKQRLHQGPPASRVDDVSCSFVTREEAFPGFEIKY